MKILMLTNTFTPHVGGVVRSVTLLRDGLQANGHEVMIVAPRFDGYEADEPGVLRVPSLRSFRGSSFSVPIPLGRPIAARIDQFAPDIVHSHHPFLLGDTALRIAASRNLPAVYTYHTRYELYGHYISMGEEKMGRMAQSLSVGYCNLCDAVIAPSASIRDELQEGGVTVPIRVIPTGIKPGAFALRDPVMARHRFGLPKGAFVVGHIGRLVIEKNLPFLAEALTAFLLRNPNVHALIAGGGTMLSQLQADFAQSGLSGRVIFTGVLQGQALADFYSAIDIFAFSSVSETQGLVLVEAMAAGAPVVALDSAGVREVVQNGENGRLLPDTATTEDFARGLQGIMELSPIERTHMSGAARQTARGFSAGRMVRQIFGLYCDAIAAHALISAPENPPRRHMLRGIFRQLRIIGNMFQALARAFMPASDG